MGVCGTNLPMCGQSVIVLNEIPMLYNILDNTRLVKQATETCQSALSWDHCWTAQPIKINITVHKNIFIAWRL